jgi:hypothetical protein
MREFQNIAASAFPSKQCFGCVLQSIFAEIAQKRIAGAERQESKRDAIGVLQSFGENPIYNFVAGAIATDGNEISVSFRIAIARKMRSVTRAGSVYRIHFDSGRAQFIQRGNIEFSGAASTSGAIHDG